MKVIILVMLLNVCSSQRVVVDAENYITRIFDNVAAQILQEGPGSLLKLADFEEDLYTKKFDKVFNGTAKFKSGFVNRIGKFEMVYLLEQAWTDTEVKV